MKLFPTPMPRQLKIPFDAPKLRGLSRDERDAVLAALGGLLLEAVDTAVTEDDDGHA